jgi:hypothetical protein
MGTQKLLSLTDRLEPSHHSLSHPGRFMGLLCPVIGISRIVMNNVRHKLTMSNAIASQLVSHDLSGFTTMASYQAFEKALRRRVVTAAPPLLA